MDKSIITCIYHYLASLAALKTLCLRASFDVAGLLTSQPSAAKRTVDLRRSGKRGDEKGSWCWVTLLELARFRWQQSREFRGFKMAGPSSWCWIGPHIRSSYVFVFKTLGVLLGSSAPQITFCSWWTFNMICGLGNTHSSLWNNISHSEPDNM